MSVTPRWRRISSMTSPAPRAPMTVAAIDDSKNHGADLSDSAGTQPRKPKRGGAKGARKAKGRRAGKTAAQVATIDTGRGPAGQCSGPPPAPPSPPGPPEGLWGRRLWQRGVLGPSGPSWYRQPLQDPAAGRSWRPLQQRSVLHRPRRRHRHLPRRRGGHHPTQQSWRWHRLLRIGCARTARSGPTARPQPGVERSRSAATKPSWRKTATTPPTGDGSTTTGPPDPRSNADLLT